MRTSVSSVAVSLAVIASKDLGLVAGAEAKRGKEVVVTGISINHFLAGKVVEAWNNWDGLGLMQQLGVVPAMGAGGE